jgi:hypothetical protein
MNSASGIEHYQNPIETKYNAILDQSYEAISILDLNTLKHVEVNNRMCDLVE